MQAIAVTDMFLLSALARKAPGSLGETLGSRETSSYGKHCGNVKGFGRHIGTKPLL
jgi:hypothetical protein